MATRYSDKTKQEVVKFVKDYDAKNGRGGQSAAKKKYKINPISIKKWCVEQGYASGPTRKKKTSAAKAKPKASAKPARRKTTRRAKPAAAAAKSVAAPVKASSTATTLRKMSDIQEKIESLQAEFEELKKSL